MSTISISGLELDAKTTHTNLSTAQLVEMILQRGEGKLASNGAVNVFTGDRTGRSPTDKRLEDTPAIHDHIDWGKVNMPITPEQFDKAVEIASRYLNTRDELFVFEGFVGPDTSHRLGVQVITTMAWHAHFAETLFIKPGSASDAGDGSWSQDWTVINAGCHKLTKEEQEELGHDTPILIAQSLEKKTVVILGTEYAGEMKKAIFTYINYEMPRQDILSMHCSATAARGTSRSSVLFGLSGTGKTTLSADPKRWLIGDDEHCWSDNGIFNIEGGCYAKAVYLTREPEPEIFDALKFGAVLENVVFDKSGEMVDFTNTSITQNTRGAYPIEYMSNAKVPCVAAHPSDVIFLTCDAFGVIPPVSRLTPEQAMYYFVSGYTAKVAGTEMGVDEPEATFSPCFGGPFLVWSPSKYAELLADKIRTHNANVWLVNTGWSGGAYGTGSRMKLAYTRAIVDSIHTGSLNDAPTTPDPVFGFEVVTQCPDVPKQILVPRDTWADKAAFDETAAKLATSFRENFQSMHGDAAEEVRNAGPKA